MKELKNTHGYNGVIMITLNVIYTMLSTQKIKVLSPTFSLVNTYELKKVRVWHFDLYRLNSAEEIHELGFEDAMVDGISLIEWPDRLDVWLPARRVEIYLVSTRSETCRQLRLHSVGGESGRWLKLW